MLSQWRDADPNIADRDGETALWCASQKGHTETAALLLQNNSDPNIANKDSETPLFVASRNGHTETAALLLQNNADPNIANKDGEAPLAIASLNSHASLRKLLREHGGLCRPVHKRAWIEDPSTHPAEIRRRLIEAETAADSSEEDEWDVPTKDGSV